MSGNDGAMPDMAYCIQMPTPGDQQGKCRSPDVADYGGIRVLWLVKQEGICHPFRNVNSRQSSSELQRFLYLFVTYIYTPPCRQMVADLLRIKDCRAATLCRQLFQNLINVIN